MGVKGLLPCLQSITRTVPLERYRGLTVAVDAMSWLHKGVFACDVRALAKSQRGKSDRSSPEELKCVNYAIKKAGILRHKFGLEVLLVIDGDSLPSKKEENEQRRKERNNAFEKAVAAETSGDSRAARRFYAQSCSVSYKIRYDLIKACKQSGISFLVAPYEADAQMARLAQTDIVDLVITEDSDMLAYGCPRVLFKTDFDTCQGQEIQLMRDIGENDSLSFKNWTHDMFVFMCIVSGCDYCKGVPGIGIKLAHKIVRVHRTPSKIFSALRAAGRMPHDFEEQFWIAFRTFRHQRVFCPSKQQIEPLCAISGSNHDAGQEEVWPFLGHHIKADIASGIANGTLHPSEKIGWDDALNLHTSREDTMRRLHINDIKIHHRPSVGTGDMHRSRAQSGKENANDADTKRKNDDMFRLFPPSKKRASNDALESDNNRPPLHEVYLVENSNENSNDGSTSQSKANLIPPCNHKDVPIHFHEYSSRLVGRSFKPLSRKRIKRDDDGTKSSKCVQQIWEKSSQIQSRVSEDRGVEDEAARYATGRYDCRNLSAQDIQRRHSASLGRYDDDSRERSARDQLRDISADSHMNDASLKRQQYDVNHSSSRQDSLNIDNSFLGLESSNFGSLSTVCEEVDALAVNFRPSYFGSSDEFQHLPHSEDQVRENFLLIGKNVGCLDSNMMWHQESDVGQNHFDHIDEHDMNHIYMNEDNFVNDNMGVFRIFQNDAEEGHNDAYFGDDLGSGGDFGAKYSSDGNMYISTKESEGMFEDELLNTFDLLQQL